MSAAATSNAQFLWFVAESPLQNCQRSGGLIAVDSATGSSAIVQRGLRAIPQAGNQEQIPWLLPLIPEIRSGANRTTGVGVGPANESLCSSSRIRSHSSDLDRAADRPVKPPMFPESRRTSVVPLFASATAEPTAHQPGIYFFASQTDENAIAGFGNFNSRRCKQIFLPQCRQHSYSRDVQTYRIAPASSHSPAIRQVFQGKNCHQKNRNRDG